MPRGFSDLAGMFSDLDRCPSFSSLCHSSIAIHLHPSTPSSFCYTFIFLLHLHPSACQYNVQKHINNQSVRAMVTTVYKHFKSGVAAEPCFKMIGAGVGIDVGDESKGCSLFPGAFVVARDSGSDKVGRNKKNRSFTQCDCEFLRPPKGK
jgi:hypothetical protein